MPDTEVRKSPLKNMVTSFLGAAFHKMQVTENLFSQCWNLLFRLPNILGQNGLKHLLLAGAWLRSPTLVESRILLVCPSNCKADLEPRFYEQNHLGRFCASCPPACQLQQMENFVHSDFGRNSKVGESQQNITATTFIGQKSKITILSEERIA